MKKSIIISIILVITLIAGFTSCGKKVDTQTPSDSNSTGIEQEGKNTEKTNPVKLRFLSWGPTEAATMPIYEEIKSSFEKENKNVTIEWVGVPFGNVKQQAFVYAASGDLPDIVETHTAFAPSFITSDIIQPLDNYFDKEFLNDFQPTSIEEGKYKGKIMAIPRILSPVVLYYNKTLFSKAGLDPNRPPKTYDEMLEMAKKISQLKTDNGDKIYGLGEGVNKQSNTGQLSFRNWYGFNASIFDANGNLNFDKKAVVNTLSYYRSLVKDGVAPLSALPKDLRNLFGTGRLGMFFDISSSATLNLISGKGKEFEKEYAVALVPVNKAGKSTTVSVAYFLSMSSNTKNAKEAAAFIKHMASKEAVEAYVKNDYDMLPTRKSMANESLFTNTDTQKTMKEQYVKYCKPMPVNHESLEQTYVEVTTAIGEAMQTDEDLEKIAERFESKLKSLYK